MNTLQHILRHKRLKRLEFFDDDKDHSICLAKAFVANVIKKFQKIIEITMSEVESDSS